MENILKCRLLKTLPCMQSLIRTLFPEIEPHKSQNIHILLSVSRAIIDI